MSGTPAGSGSVIRTEYAGTLADILVVQTSDSHAASIAGMMLADNGARVIKVDDSSLASGDPGGRRLWDRGKQSIELPRGARLERLRPVLERADVLVHEQFTSAGDPISAAYETLWRRYPRLVICTLTPYGNSGPLAHRPGNDSLVSARTGLAADQPGWLPGPVYVVHPLPSLAAALLAVQGVVAALIARDRTGRGQRVDVSLVGGSVALTAYASGGALRRRELSWVAGPVGLSPFAACYECADGRWITVACIHSAFVGRAIEALDIKEAADEILKGAGYETPVLLRSPELCAPLFELVANRVRTKSADEWIRRFEAADVPVGAANTPDEALRLLSDLGFAIQVDDPEVGRLVQIAPPIRFGDTHRIIRPRALPGQHSEHVAREFGVNTAGPPKSPPAESLPLGRWHAPLRGVRVVEIANVIAGPLTARFLADLGADVIKIEAPHGGDIARKNESPEFVALNAGKRSIVVDLKAPEGREIGRELALSADVIVNNMRRGVAERLGMGADELRREKPALVYCQISAYGKEGPLATRPGFDSVAGSLAGLAMSQGGASMKPARLRVAMVDHTASLLAAAGVLMALFARSRSGKGTVVETSLLEAAMLVGGDRLMQYEGPAPQPLIPQYGPDALERLYPTLDGWIQLSTTDASFDLLCELLGKPSMVHEKRFDTRETRRANDAELSEALTAIFLRRTSRAWSDLLEPRGIGCAPVVQNYEEGVFLDPQAAALGLIAGCGPSSDLRVAHRWFTLSASENGCQGPPPELGEDGPDIMRELGYTSTRIADFRARGIVGSGSTTGREESGAADQGIAERIGT